MRKLNWEIVDRIRNEFSDTDDRCLAEQFDISVSAIKNIKNYRTWKPEFRSITQDLNFN